MKFRDEQRTFPNKIWERGNLLASLTTKAASPSASYPSAPEAVPPARPRSRNRHKRERLSAKAELSPPKRPRRICA
jgi:hypothetical protein